MRTYVLAADTLEDLRGWLRALGRASRAEGDDGWVQVLATSQTSTSNLSPSNHPTAPPLYANHTSG